MIVNLILFAQAKEIVGKQQIEMQLEDQATLGDLKVALGEQFPALSNLLVRCAFSVDQEYSNDKRALQQGCEVACIPPVSGG